MFGQAFGISKYEQIIYCVLMRRNRKISKIFLIIITIINCLMFIRCGQNGYEKKLSTEEKLEQYFSDFYIFDSNYEVGSIIRANYDSKEYVVWQGGFYKLWIPDNQKIKGQIILHQGHNNFNGSRSRESESLIQAAEFLKSKGYKVHGFEMPPFPHQGRPLNDFIDPLLDYLDEIGPAYMMGLSGGGWTTTIMTAIDDRIIKGYSIAGDAPHDISEGPRDYEQNMIKDYRQIYKLAGDRLYHIYNENDPCCFSDIEDEIDYEFYVDKSHQTHQISQSTLEFILKDIEGLN